MASPILTKGVLLPPVSHHNAGPRPILPRKEIREIKKNDVQWQIFLFGLLRFQQADANDENGGTKWKSYYRIAGIHGLPYEAYNGVDNSVMKIPATSARNGGYCMHSSTLFATWHRPYLALFEQELYEHVQDAAMYLGHPLAFKDFRLPYWDWTIGNFQDQCYPDFMFQENVQITIGNEPFTIRNPLASFKTESKEVPPVPAVGRLPTYTVRAPNAPKQGLKPEEAIRLALWGDARAGGLVASGRQQQVSALLQNKKLRFNDFSTNKYLESGVGAWDSLESVHDEIHGSTGQGGHMSILDVAGFDPLFWLHHCMVDRLLYIRQKTFSGQHVEPVKITKKTAANNPRSTFVGEEINEKSALWPFYEMPETFWTSEHVEDAANLGYSYEINAKTPKQFRQAVQQMFPDISAVTASLEPGQPDEAVEAPAPPAAPEAPPARSPLLDEDNSYDNWTLNIRTVKHTLGSVYTIFAFIGDFDATNPAGWRADPANVGNIVILGRDLDTFCSKCQDDMQDDLVVTGVVSLTPALVDHMRAGDLASLRPADVVPYLEKTLHWRVLVGNDTEVPREEVQGLFVCVSSNKVTVDEDGIPDFSPDHVVHREITAGHPGGLGLHDEF